MVTNRKIRVGIVGANPSRGFASIAHIPALQALADFEISAVCTTRQDSADAAARHYGVPLAFCDAEKLAQHTDVDLVTVSVKVPDHYQPVMAAIEAGKHVYCEWPLGRNTDEAIRMRDAANRKGIRHAVGLQGQVSPAINYTKDLIADGYVGRVLSATMIGCAPNWGPTHRPCLPSRFRERRQPADDHRRAYDRCAMLLPRRISRACCVRREPTRPHTCRGNRRADRQNRARPSSSSTGIVGEGAVVSFQIRGGMNRGTAFLFEIHGEEGDLQLTATSRASMQRQELQCERGAR